MNSSSLAATVHPLLVPRDPVSGRTLIWSFLAGLGITLPVMGLVGLLPLPELAGPLAEAKDARMMQLYLHPGLLALKAVLFYPLIEELFYRGLLLSMCRRRLSHVSALIVPNLIFAITHIGSGWTNVVFALLVGWFFSWLVVRSESLLPAMLCHAAINAMVLFVYRPLWDSGAFVPELTRLSGAGNALIVVMVSLAVFGTGWRLLRDEFQSRRTVLAA